MHERETALTRVQHASEVVAEVQGRELNRAWESATRQLLSRVSELEKKLRDTQHSIDIRPSLMEALTASEPDSPVVQTASVLAAKDRERDSMVEVANELRAFVLRVSQLDANANALELQALVRQAGQVIEVRVCHQQTNSNPYTQSILIQFYS